MMGSHRCIISLRTAVSVRWKETSKNTMVSIEKNLLDFFFRSAVKSNTDSISINSKHLLTLYYCYLICLTLLLCVLQLQIYFYRYIFLYFGNKFFLIE